MNADGEWGGRWNSDHHTSDGPLATPSLRYGLQRLFSASSSHGSHSNTYFLGRLWGLHGFI